jgi:hypothetical protein
LLQLQPRLLGLQLRGRYDEPLNRIRSLPMARFRSLSVDQS